jgi:hypothetical protein
LWMRAHSFFADFLYIQNHVNVLPDNVVKILNWSSNYEMNNATLTIRVG